MKHLKSINENISSDNPEIKKALVKMAEVVAQDANGSSVHPCEYFNSMDLYELAFGDEKFAEIINSGLDYFFEKYNEDFDVSLAYRTMDFYIHPDTLEIAPDYKSKSKGYISFHNIGTSINMQRDEKLNKFALYPDSLNKFQRFQDALSYRRR